MKSADPQEQTIILPDGRVVTIRARSAEAYSPNPNNSNRGKPRGVAALDESLQLSGLHRGIVVAADGTVVNGNHAYESAVANGVALAWIEVDVEGDVGVATRRTDWTDARVPAAIAAAHADNRSAQLNYDLDPEQFAVDLQVLAELGQSLPATLFTEEEINFALGQADTTPDFDPVGVDEQGRLDEQQPKEIDCVCPKCGEQFIKMQPSIK